MERLLTVIFAGVLSLSMVVGFIFITDQPEPPVNQVGQELKANVEQNELQQSFAEARQTGQVEELF